jgi:hypothetical protein
VLDRSPGAGHLEEETESLRRAPFPCAQHLCRLPRRWLAGGGGRRSVWAPARFTGGSLSLSGGVAGGLSATMPGSTKIEVDRRASGVNRQSTRPEVREQ